MVLLKEVHFNDLGRNDKELINVLMNKLGMSNSVFNTGVYRAWYQYTQLSRLTILNQKQSIFSTTQ